MPVTGRQQAVLALTPAFLLTSRPPLSLQVLAWEEADVQRTAQVLTKLRGIVCPAAAAGVAEGMAGVEMTGLAMAPNVAAVAQDASVETAPDSSAAQATIQSEAEATVVASTHPGVGGSSTPADQAALPEGKAYLPWGHLAVARLLVSE